MKLGIAPGTMQSADQSPNRRAVLPLAYYFDKLIVGFIGETLEQGNF